jgi:hypothetical protein
MRPAVSVWNLKLRDKKKLPDDGGVLMIMCIKSNGQYEPIAHMKCDDILSEAESRSDQLPFACDGTLAYWVCTDPEKMDEAWAEAEELAQK